MKIDQIKSAVVNTLEKIIMGNLEGFRDTESFEVRPGYGYDKFYLDWVEGSYDMSLQGLIHSIMYEEGFYKEILTDGQYADMEKVIEDSPDAIYGPEMDEDDELQSTLDDIYDVSITYVAKKLTELGFDVEEAFSEYFELLDEEKFEACKAKGLAAKKAYECIESEQYVDSTSFKETQMKRLKAFKKRVEKEEGKGYCFQFKRLKVTLERYAESNSISGRLMYTKDICDEFYSPYQSYKRTPNEDDELWISETFEHAKVLLLKDGEKPEKPNSYNSTAYLTCKKTRTKAFCDIGTAYFKNACNFEEAIKYYNLALEKNDDPSILSHIARDYAMLGLPGYESGRNLFLKIMDDEKRIDFIVDILERIEELDTSIRYFDYDKECAEIYAIIGLEEKAYNLFAEAISNANDVHAIAVCLDSFREYSKPESKDALKKLYDHGLIVAEKLGCVSELKKYTFYDEVKEEDVSFENFYL